MEDLKAVAWMVRYGARGMAYNLEFIPEERRDWQPDPAAKSPLEIAAEAVRALGMYRAIFDGPDYPRPWPPYTPPASLAEARTLLLAGAEDYAAALEAAGPELDRPQAMPFGGTFRAYRAVCYPLLDLMHHHGQICYLQCLLGDRETHWNEAAIADEFAWKDGETE